MKHLNESLLNSIHRFSRTLRQKRMSTDLVFHEFIILRNILRIQSEGNINIYPSDLSERLNLSRSYVTAVLNSLDTKQLLSRTVDNVDRRRIKIEITDKGRRIFDDMAKIELEQADILIKNLSEEKTILLIDLLEQASNILNKGE